MKTTLTLRTAVISFLALMVVACGAAGVSAQQALPGDVSSLAGKWVGRLTPSNQIIELQIQPDGSYTSVSGTTTGEGTITMVGGKLMADGHLVTGPNSTTAGPEKSVLTVSNKAGKPVISGNGRDNVGPYSFQLTRE